MRRGLNTDIIVLSFLAHTLVHLPCKSSVLDLFLTHIFNESQFQALPSSEGSVSSQGLFFNKYYVLIALRPILYKGNIITQLGWEITFESTSQALGCLI